MNKIKDFAPVKRGKGHLFCKSHGKLESMIHDTLCCQYNLI